MNNEVSQNERERPGQDSPISKKNWEEPRLTFVEPKLTAHGTLGEVTGAFFGSFSS